ncbi:hypothetical protein RSOLAG22IIIB_01460 [Rhizoctonia solani]|uniref:C2H2-type domain-containing protein n=1 Tax=Rhizoctonia solani TaxID=456999 RepID=A0A0K6G6H6_9AGAM|nr:hypothetical protein RSOLAG22IIIB_01460 [Rhizoctonia solani]
MDALQTSGSSESYNPLSLYPSLDLIDRLTWGPGRPSLIMQKQKRKIRADRLCTVHYAGRIKNRSIAAGSSLPRSTPLHLIHLDLRPIPSASKTYFLPVLPLACRWGDCDQVCESPSQLAMHMRVVHLPSIAEHIPSYASVNLLPHLEPPLPPPELPAGPVVPVYAGSQSHPKYASDDDREDEDDEGDMDEDKDSNLDQIDEDQEHPYHWGTCDLTFLSDVALTDHLTSDHVLK